MTSSAEIKTKTKTANVNMKQNAHTSGKHFLTTRSLLNIEFMTSYSTKAAKSKRNPLGEYWYYFSKKVVKQKA